MEVKIKQKKRNSYLRDIRDNNEEVPANEVVAARNKDYTIFPITVSFVGDM
ncbi:hypothetical protein [Aureibaculum luteum]|uniref:hypothetical protein n=1 Tax=Aureibaculum luteum TaxID=1548456 RepID=UPI001300B707|nr:hypothetical protein [Aureibaculum luteum]